MARRLPNAFVQPQSQQSAAFNQRKGRISEVSTAPSNFSDPFIPHCQSELSTTLSQMDRRIPNPYPINQTESVEEIVLDADSEPTEWSRRPSPISRLEEIMTVNRTSDARYPTSSQEERDRRMTREELLEELRRAREQIRSMAHSSRSGTWSGMRRYIGSATRSLTSTSLGTPPPPYADRSSPRNTSDA
jgi:hypothetical protein